MAEWNIALFEGEPFDELLMKPSAEMTYDEKKGLLAALDTPERLDELAMAYAAKGQNVPDEIAWALAKAANMGDAPVDRDPNPDEQRVIDAANAFYDRITGRAKELDKARRFHSTESEDAPPVMPWDRLKKAVSSGEKSLATAIDLYRYAKQEGVVMTVGEPGQERVLDMTGPATREVREMIVHHPDTVIAAVEVRRQARHAPERE